MNDLFDAIQCTAVTINLRPTSNSGFDTMARGINRNGFFQRQAACGCRQRMWPGTNQRHVAFYDVKELGQFIQA